MAERRPTEDYLQLAWDQALREAPTGRPLPPGDTPSGWILPMTAANREQADGAISLDGTRLAEGRIARTQPHVFRR